MEAVNGTNVTSERYLTALTQEFKACGKKLAPAVLGRKFIGIDMASTLPRGPQMIALPDQEISLWKKARVRCRTASDFLERPSDSARVSVTKAASLIDGRFIRTLKSAPMRPA